MATNKLNPSSAARNFPFGITFHGGDAWPSAPNFVRKKIKNVYLTVGSGTINIEARLAGPCLVSSVIPTPSPEYALLGYSEVPLSSK